MRDDSWLLLVEGGYVASLGGGWIRAWRELVDGGYVQARIVEGANRGDSSGPLHKNAKTERIWALAQKCQNRAD